MAFLQQKARLKEEEEEARRLGQRSRSEKELFHNVNEFEFDNKAAKRQFMNAVTRSKNRKASKHQKRSSTLMVKREDKYVPLKSPIRNYGRAPSRQGTSKRFITPTSRNVNKATAESRTSVRSKSRHGSQERL